MTSAETKARTMIKGATTKQIVLQFELTNMISNENIPTVRGWLMEELEERNPEAFEAWIDSDEDSPRNFF